jgi:hypothetical protein
MTPCDLLRKWHAEAESHGHQLLAHRLAQLMHLFGCDDVSTDAQVGPPPPPPPAP